MSSDRITAGQLVSRVNKQDISAGLKLIEYYIRPALADIDLEAINAWKYTHKEIDTTLVSHIYATLKFRWFQLGKNPF